MRGLFNPCHRPRLSTGLRVYKSSCVRSFFTVPFFFIRHSRGLSAVALAKAEGGNLFSFILNFYFEPQSQTKLKPSKLKTLFKLRFTLRFNFLRFFAPSRLKIFEPQSQTKLKPSKLKTLFKLRFTLRFNFLRFFAPSRLKIFEPQSQTKLKPSKLKTLFKLRFTLRFNFLRFFAPSRLKIFEPQSQTKLKPSKLKTLFKLRFTLQFNFLRFFAPSRLNYQIPTFRLRQGYGGQAAGMTVFYFLLDCCISIFRPSAFNSLVRTLKLSGTPISNVSSPRTIDS